MLPLWIVDLRAKSPRRDCFVSLLGRIPHVFVDKPDKEDGSSADSQSDESYGTGEKDLKVNSNPTIVADGSNLKDVLDSIDRLEADRNSVIEGTYWRYSAMDDYFYGLSITSNAQEIKKHYDEDHILYDIEENPTAETTANRLYRFQSDLVTEGQKFIRQLRESNVHPDIKINVVVLGDITEDFTRIVFPSIATILQKEKERILPHHVHQGMEIIGMLYIPSDINTHEVNIRRSMQRTMHEIDVQYRVNDIRGYDHVMLYQDVQNRTQCTYRLLNDEHLAEYLLQCLVHLYLACSDSHPLLSGTSSADVFYFSMGATSVHFDTADEDAKCRHALAIDLIRSFKSEGTHEKESQNLSILDIEKNYSPRNFFKFDDFSKIAFDYADPDAPSPHPIRNFFAKYLKRRYYNFYLRFFTRNYLNTVMSQIEDETRSSLEVIAADSKRRMADVQKSVRENIRTVIGRLSANDGGLPTIVRLFKEFQETFSKYKESVKSAIEENFWNQIEDGLPRYLQDQFIEYHSAYERDIREKNGGKYQQQMKKEAIDQLNGIISKEATFMSRICRSVLLGIIGVIAVLPLLNVISPTLINLGNVWNHRVAWGIGLFFVPIIAQIISLWRYNRKKKRAVNNLKAIYMHDAYARVANRIESEITSFYDKMIQLADKYIERCEKIRLEVGYDFVRDTYESSFPETMFNQPLVGGHFGNEQLLPLSEIEDAEININYIGYRLNEIGQVEHFLFINQHKDKVARLFDDVRVCENLERRIKDDGTEELVTKDQQEEELQKLWEIHRDVFHQQLNDAIKDAFRPRENATVGEKLHHFCVNSFDRFDVMRSVAAYAATNGELTTSADREFSDVKINVQQAQQWILPYIPSTNNLVQIDKYHRMYSKYIFVTRWRCFDHFSLNRILPTEDFDMAVRRERVTGCDEKSYRQEDYKTTKDPKPTDNDPIAEDKSKKFVPKISSLLLWALCPRDSSSEWFRLFNAEFFANAYEYKNQLRAILNQDD